MNIFPFIPGYTENIVQADREPAFVVVIAFILTFIVARLYTRLARLWGWGSVSLSGTHAHHMVFGLVIAFAAAGAQFAFLPEQGFLQLFFAAAFGSGVALVLDEFALLFHLEDVYWEKEGRKSIDAVLLALAFSIIFLLHVTPLATPSEESTGAAFFFAVAINLVFVTVTALKGKIFLAVFGIFIPTLAQIGAIRLAEPDSIWAKKLYNPTGKKMRRSILRYKNYEQRWRPVKETMWDIVGGKTGRPPKK